jgi:lysozyme
MQLSDKGQGFIKQFERYRPTAYKPTRIDKWTCGWGHTGADVGPTTTCDYAKAQAWFMSDTAEAVHTVNSHITAPLTQNQFDMLVSLAYNIGATNFAASHHFIAALNARDYKGAANRFLQFDHEGGVEVPGLENRREAERAIFLKP